MPVRASIYRVARLRQSFHPLVDIVLADHNRKVRGSCQGKYGTFDKGTIRVTKDDVIGIE